MRAIPERLGDASRGGTIQINYFYLYLFTLLLTFINRHILLVRDDDDDFSLAIFVLKFTSVRSFCSGK